MDLIIKYKTINLSKDNTEKIQNLKVGEELLNMTLKPKR